MNATPRKYELIDRENIDRPKPETVEDYLAARKPWDVYWLDWFVQLHASHMETN